MSSSRAKPAISVIVTVYDRFEYLPEALGTVREQTFRGPVEVLVVDDGSTRPAEGLLADRFPEVQWIRQTNQGLCAARDTGSRASSGEFIVYLDDDDLWRAERLAAQYRFLEVCPEADLVYCDMVRFTPSGEAPRGYYGSALDLLLKAKHRVVEGIPGGFLFEPGALLPFSLEYDPLAAATVMIRRGFLDKMGGWDPAVWMPADCHDFFLRAAFLGHVGYLNVPLVRYRRGHTHITKGHVGPRFEESRILCGAVRGYPEPLQAAIRPWMLRYLARIGLLCARSRMIGRSFSCFRQSFVIDPRPNAVLAAWSSVVQSTISRYTKRRSEKAEYL